MLTTLKIKLETEERIKFAYGSLFHGWLMQILNTDYVEILHNQQLNPYSQYLYFDKVENCYIWKISTFTDEAREQIIEPLLKSNKKIIELTYNNLNFKIKSKELLEEKTYKEIADEAFLSEEVKHILKLKFLTPTTYKSNGDYQLFPDIKALYTSIYNKWNTFSPEISLADEEVFKHLSEHSQIIKYNLKSIKYDIEGVKLASFIGEISVLIKGPHELARISNMLFEFAKYSGIGAKTSLGMGGVEIE